MNAVSGKSGLEALLSRVTEYVQARTSSNEAPLRAEVFSLEQLVHHAKALAENHSVVAQRGPTDCSRGWVKMNRY